MLHSDKNIVLHTCTYTITFTWLIITIHHRFTYCTSFCQRGRMLCDALLRPPAQQLCQPKRCWRSRTFSWKMTRRRGQLVAARQNPVKLTFISSIRSGHGIVSLRFYHSCCTVLYCKDGTSSVDHVPKHKTRQTMTKWRHRKASSLALMLEHPPEQSMCEIRVYIHDLMCIIYSK